MPTDLFDQALKKKNRTPTLQTESGAVELLDCNYDIFSTEDALVRLQDLHLRSSDDEPLLELQLSPTKEQAFSLYSIGITTSMLKMIMLSEDARNEYVYKLGSVIEQLGDASGLDPLIMCAYANLPKNDVRMRLAGIVSKSGQLTKVGGGGKSSFTLEHTRAKKEGFVTVESAHIKKHRFTTDGIRKATEKCMQEVDDAIRGTTAESPLSTDQCKTLASICGGIAGTITGAIGGYFVTKSVVGALTGAAAGGGTGYKLGGDVGNLICIPPVDKAVKQTPAPGSPAADVQETPATASPAADAGAQDTAVKDAPVRTRQDVAKQAEKEKEEKEKAAREKEEKDAAGKERIRELEVQTAEEGCEAPYRWDDLRQPDEFYITSSRSALLGYFAIGPGLDSYIEKTGDVSRLTRFPVLELNKFPQDVLSGKSLAMRNAGIFHQIQEMTIARNTSNMQTILSTHLAAQRNNVKIMPDDMASRADFKIRTVTNPGRGRYE